MRRLIYHLQTTFDHRISTASGEFWEPFPLGDVETDYLTERFALADTWVFGRNMYEAIVPWWTEVAVKGAPPEGGTASAADLAFASVIHGLRKVVISSSLPANDERDVLSGDVAARLAELKEQDGKDIVLSCGPGTLAPLANTPGLIDEYFLSLSPVVLSAGPKVFDGLERDLALETDQIKVFAGGLVMVHYRVRP